VPRGRRPGRRRRAWPALCDVLGVLRVSARDMPLAAPVEPGGRLLTTKHTKVTKKCVSLAKTRSTPRNALNIGRPMGATGHETGPRCHAISTRSVRFPLRAWRLCERHGFWRRPSSPAESFQPRSTRRSRRREQKSFSRQAARYAKKNEWIIGRPMGATGHETGPRCHAISTRSVRFPLRALRLCERHAFGGARRARRKAFNHEAHEGHEGLRTKTLRDLRVLRGSKA